MSIANIGPPAPQRLPPHLAPIEQLRQNLTLAHLVTAGLSVGELLEESVCPCCREQAFDVALRRLNTAYANDRLNWLVSCQQCFLEAVGHYADLWDMYYSDCF